jgi:exo-beta-1,3-glucanase (GH17 family)/cellulose synthase/poly-beta-1,6-N-acetylglucosamine synthase-like glycosyltransferase
MTRKAINNLAANAIIAIAVAALTYSLWAFLNRPEHEPLWPNIVPGFSFSPMRMNHDPVKGKYPTLEEIDEDLAILEDKCHSIRTYSVEGTLSEIPALAEKRGLNVVLGAWLSRDMERNQKEVQGVIGIARKHRNVVRVIVGNESVLREDMPMSQLMAYLDEVRKKLNVPISTAEPWHIWIRYPELADYVDFIAVHLLPYWEGVDVDLAVDYSISCYETLKKAFPKKPIVISEIGWPSNGRIRRAAEPGVANQAAFLRRFVNRAAKEKYTYYIMEAFDQPWKADEEGAVGAYWGIYDVNRKQKFSLTEPIVNIPGWPLLAGLSIVISVLTLSMMLIDSKTLKSRGRGFLAIIAYGAATAAVWVVYSYTRQYLTIPSLIVGILLVIGMAGVILVLLAEAHEWAEAIWIEGRRRTYKPDEIKEPFYPMVSVHIPAYNEPPDMMIQTLEALSRLDYPEFEVIVMDNNTKDPKMWEPVSEYCAKLGPRFRFFHVDPLSGFKAGALNYALKQTHPKAKVVAVIDSDYVVSSRWLREMVPAFRNPRVAIVQAPQDYRDSEANTFKTMCYYEYKGFFHIGMMTRNERNAIIQHGTMTMVRKVSLEEVGGWAEWCITEDAELGLRIFNAGYEAIYTPESYGKGFMPDTFDDYKKQRYRWAYGSVQIIKKHFRVLSGREGNLSLGQRYHFSAGWLPWIADSINLVFNMAALGWSVAMIVAPDYVDPPLVIFSTLPLSFFVFKAAKLFYLYHYLMGVPILQTGSSALAGLSLSHVIGRAILSGVFTKNMGFYRTPKMASSHGLLRALGSAREEMLFMIAMWLSAACIGFGTEVESPDIYLWVIVLLIQSIPYCSAVVTSIISAMTTKPSAQ